MVINKVVANTLVITKTMVVKSGNNYSHPIKEIPCIMYSLIDESETTTGSTCSTMLVTIIAGC